MVHTYHNLVSLWKKWNVNSETAIDLRLNSFKILFAYNSGKIENSDITYNDTREVFENGKVLNYSGDPRTVFEIYNQKLCYEELKPKIVTNEKLSIDLIKSVHSVLLNGCYTHRNYIELGERPGSFKKNDFEVGLARVGAMPEEVEAELSDLINDVNDYRGVDFLKVSAYFHARFEYIHPFADGNGRVGRALTNYFLMINDAPPLIVYDDEKSKYYNALNKYDTHEDIEPLYSLFESNSLRTWEKALDNDLKRCSTGSKEEYLEKVNEAKSALKNSCSGSPGETYRER